MFFSSQIIDFVFALKALHQASDLLWFLYKNVFLCREKMIEKINENRMHLWYTQFLIFRNEKWLEKETS